MLKPSRNAAANPGKSFRLATAFASRIAARLAGQCKTLCPAEDIRLAQLWVADRAPIADVITVLEVRYRFDLSQSDCRAYAVAILALAEQHLHAKAKFIPTPKETSYAAA